ncbi:MAG TPA: AAA family ATPase [Thermoanaerobaculia bacterium]|jgi:MoxR-like ATPase|nr:AAA family ATPase [Thermoanaerobaculia bacterium]
MSWPPETLGAVNRLKSVQRQLKQMFTGRETAVELLAVATICREHLLLIGPPGTAKTELLTRFTEQVAARGFHYLLTRFTEPSELFGPLDLEKFRKGTFHIRTEGMLPEAQIAFLDEVFQGSSAILNSLLTLVNERVFHNGSRRQEVPLISLVGASNSLPDDPAVHAFADRFVLRLQVDRVPDERLDELIGQGWELELERIESTVLAGGGTGGAAPRLLAPLEVADLVALHGRVGEVQIDDIQPIYATVVRELRAEGIEISDRRVVKGLKLVAAAALLREATAAAPADLWPLNHFWSRPEEAEVVQAVIQPRVSEDGGRQLQLSRPAPEMLADLGVLEAQEPGVRTEVALGAHLMALNRLRKEALRFHRGDAALRKRIEEVIQRSLGRLEGAHV